MSAALALSWEVLARYRWWLRIGVAYLAVACLAVAVMPLEWRWPEFGAALASPATVLALLVMLSFESGNDLRSTASGFPRRLFTLPVSSFLLATSQFGVAMLTLTALWLVVAVGLLRPCGANVPLVLPALAIAASVGWLQALAWSPFPLWWLRLGLIVVAVSGLFVLPVAIAEGWFVPGWLTAALVLSLALAYLVALSGVHRGRRGVGAWEPAQVDRADLRTGTVDLTPFASPFRAQLHLELRHLGWVSAWLFLFQLLVLLPPVHMMDYALRTKPFLFEALGELKVMGENTVRLGPAWLSLQIMLMMPIAFAFLGGMDPSPHLLSPRGGMSNFFATRAVDEPTIVRAKLMGKAIILAILWGEIAFLGLTWAAIGGHIGDMVERLGDVAGLPSMGGVVLVVGVLAAAVVNWLGMIGGVWIGLSGRAWVSGSAIVLVSAVCVVAAIVAKNWDPSWQPWLTGLVSAGLVLKVALTVWVCRRLLARGYADGRTLLAILTAWLVVVETLAGLAVWFLAGSWLTVLTLFLLIPLPQTLAAPLALGWNRHR